MKALVLGGTGKIGTAVAWDLVRRDEVEKVGLVGRRPNALEEVRHFVGYAEKTTTHRVAVGATELGDIMAQYDVGVLALPDRKSSYQAARAAIEAQLNIVDMLEEYHRRPDPYEMEGLELPSGVSLDDYGEWLHDQAVSAEVTFLDGVGFAPGLSNITLGRAIRMLDKTDSAVARVGGVPEWEAAARRPLRYMVTWVFDHVLREYMIPVKVLQDGQIAEVPALTEREQFRFQRFGVDYELECAITPGMPSFIYTRPELRNFAEKTIRWPGHYQGIEVLKECGLLDLEPVQVDGNRVVPREFLLHVLQPRLQPESGDGDVCVMWNTAEGILKGNPARIDYYMWDEADHNTGISSMARVTGFATAIGAWLVGRGVIRIPGIVAPEDAIFGDLYDTFIKELEGRNIRIQEEVAAR
ncbi:MAG: saccharopine dehydrogenase C-terminal domain-containing protein [Candidatus Bipolaricaulota bacterium]